MSELLQIVGLIKDKKKAQIQWSNLTVDQRFLHLRDHFSNPEKLSSLRSLGLEMGLQDADREIYVQSWFARLLKEREALISLPDDRNYYLPLGLIAFGADSNQALRNSVALIFDGLLAGNAIFVSSQSPALKILFGFDAPYENLVSFVADTSESFEFLIQHPAIKSVSGIFTEEKQLAYEKLAMGRKTYCFLSHGKNAAVILPDFDENLIRQQLIPSMILCDGQLPESISRIYCVESALPQFMSVLAESWPKDFRVNISSKAENLKKVLSQIRQESGKPLFGQILDDNQMSAILIKDLPNCSELMQLPLLAPIVTLTEIKYPFDAAKWVNNSDYAVCASIYGPEEKLAKFASKFEVASVALNSWSFLSSTLPAGSKSSQRGLSDCGPRSGLFNFVGKLTH